jgi:hypothetical protein
MPEEPQANRLHCKISRNSREPGRVTIIKAVQEDVWHKF